MHYSQATGKFVYPKSAILGAANTNILIVKKVLGDPAARGFYSLIPLSSGVFLYVHLNFLAPLKFLEAFS